MVGQTDNARNKVQDADDRNGYWALATNGEIVLARASSMKVPGCPSSVAEIGLFYPNSVLIIAKKCPNFVQCLKGIYKLTLKSGKYSHPVSLWLSAVQGRLAKQQ